MIRIYYLTVVTMQKKKKMMHCYKVREYNSLNSCHCRNK